MVKNLPTSVGDPGDMGSIPESGKFLTWRRTWQPTPVFWPGEFHEPRSLVGYSPRRCKESGMTVHACIELYTFSYQNVRVRAYI